MLFRSHERGVVVDRIKIDRRRGSTFYARFGDLFAAMCAVGVIVALGVQRFSRTMPVPRGAIPKDGALISS